MIILFYVLNIDNQSNNNYNYQYIWTLFISFHFRNQGLVSNLHDVHY